MGCFAVAVSLPFPFMWGTALKAVYGTGQGPEHSRKTLLLDNIFLLVPQEFIDNKEKDTKYIWIGVKVEDEKKQRNLLGDPRVKENRWLLVAGLKGKASLAKAKVCHSAWKYNSEPKLFSQSIDLVLQSQAPIFCLFHHQFKQILLGTSGSRFVLWLQDQPQSQFLCLWLQREIVTHFSH